MELESKGRLLPPPRDRDDRATGAAFSPDGSTLYLRTYRRIYRYAWPAMSVISPEDGFDIEDLDEPQGERSEERRVGREGRSRLSPHHCHQRKGKLLVEKDR